MEDSTTSLWTYYQETVNELKQRLINTNIEMEALRIETSEELRKCHENVKQLLHLLRIACYERDQAMSKIPIGSTIALKSSNRVANSNFSDSSNLSDVCDSSNNLQRIPPDRATLFIENVTRGKPLPQKGRFLSAVLASGPLLQTLLVAGPMPQWRNPPPLFSAPHLDGGGTAHNKSYSSYLEDDNLTCMGANPNGYFQMGNKLRF